MISTWHIQATGWRFRPSGLCCCLAGLVDYRRCSVPRGILRGPQTPWKWRWYVPSKRQEPNTQRRSITSQKTGINPCAVKTSKLAGLHVTLYHTILHTLQLIEHYAVSESKHPAVRVWTGNWGKTPRARKSYKHGGSEWPGHLTTPIWPQQRGKKVRTVFQYELCSSGPFPSSHLQGSRIHKPWRWDRQVVPKRRYEITTTRCVITQRSAVFIYLLRRGSLKSRNISVSSSARGTVSDLGSTLLGSQLDWLTDQIFVWFSSVLYKE
jgi:hypothetical protein